MHLEFEDKESSEHKLYVARDRCLKLTPSNPHKSKLSLPAG